MHRENFAHFLLRFAVGIIFLLFGWMKISGQLQPPIEKIITFLPAETSLLVMGLAMIIIGLSVIIGLWITIAAWFGALIMVAVIGSGIYLGLFWELNLIKDIPILIIFIALGLMEERDWTFDAWLGAPPLK